MHGVTLCTLSSQRVKLFCWESIVVYFDHIMKMAVVWTPGDWNAMISDAIELKNAHTHSSFFNKEERVVNICGLFMCHPTNSRSPSVHISSLIALE